MITTIQLNESVKNKLDKLKSNKETYEQVIINLIEVADRCKREQKDLLIEGCKAMAEENIKITKEFESIEDFKDWKW